MTKFKIPPFPERHEHKEPPQDVESPSALAIEKSGEDKQMAVEMDETGTAKKVPRESFFEDAMALARAAQRVDIAATTRKTPEDRIRIIDENIARIEALLAQHAQGLPTGWGKILHPFLARDTQREIDRLEAERARLLERRAIERKRIPGARGA